MKFTFAAGLVAMCVSAQEDTAAVAIIEEEPVEECPFLKVFEQNEVGQWEFKDSVMPNLPQISFADVDEQAIRDWIDSTETSMELQDQKWVDAWSTYMDAVAQPWNDFLTQAEQVSIEGRELGIKTDEEVIRFVADNTFLDGQSLNEIFPQVESFLAEYRAQAENLEEVFNFDAFRTTPEVLQRTGYYDADGVYYPNEVMQDTYNESDYDSEDSSDGFEVVMDKIESAAVSYGYDSEVVQAWLQDKGTSWKELQQSHDVESIAQKKADVAEAADYIKGILDNMVNEMRTNQVEDQANFETALDDKVSDLKSKVDEQAQSNIDNLSNWFDQAYNNIIDATAEEEEPVEEVVVISLAAKKPSKAKHQSKASSSAYGYGTLALGGAAVSIAAYLYKKNQDAAKEIKVSGEILDEGFIQV